MRRTRIARCLRRRMVQKRHPIPVLLLLDAYSLSIVKLVLRRRNCAHALLCARPPGEFDSLVYRRRDRLHTSAFDEGRELNDCGNPVSRGPGLVRYHDGVHELLWPCVFDLQSLLVLEGLWAETAEDRNGVHGMEFSVRETGKSRTHHGSPELIVH